MNQAVGRALYIERRDNLEQQVLPGDIAEAQAGSEVAQRRIHTFAGPYALVVAQLRDRQDVLHPRLRARMALNQVPIAVHSYDTAEQVLPEPDAQPFYVHLGHAVIRQVDAAVVSRLSVNNEPDDELSKTAINADKVKLTKRTAMVVRDLFLTPKAMAIAHGVALSTLRSQLADSRLALQVHSQEIAAAVYAVAGRVDLEQVPEGRTNFLDPEELEVVKRHFDASADDIMRIGVTWREIKRKMGADSQVQVVLMAVRDGEITREVLQQRGLIAEEEK